MKLAKSIGLAIAGLAVAGLAALAPGAAIAKTVIRVQSVIPAKADEVTMLNDFAKDVLDLTNGEVEIQVLPAGAVVGVQETLDAVDSGLIEGGFAWTHYWSGKHPAAMLFGSPVAGAGVGIDNIAFLSWFLYGGGQELYDELWKEMGVNVKGLMLQPVGPEALGWFREPINSMADFRKYRFRTPPGIPGQTYNDIGVAAVAMGGGDILPALEKGTIDAAEWCCPKPDSVFGFQKVLKHYYLQGLHQVVVNADIYINGDVWKSLTPHQQRAMQVAANASLTKSMAYRIIENGRALKDLVDNHGVQLHDTPEDYFKEYMEAARRSLEKNAAENAFFKKVWESQRDFANIAVPFWAGSQLSNANLGMAYARSLKK
ncbi:MAG: C4-dicarboxylate ABC transporter substrate-binding protein [Rhizobiales bacterium]|nr:C4-dicarboxylate ABC transporter substrate-binding protein [Hyphomicrobiales bacterium]